MKKTKSSTTILAVAVIAATALGAFALNASVSTAAQVDEQGLKETRNTGSQGTTVLHKVNSHHIVNATLNQSKVEELRIAQHHLWIEHVVWTRQYIVASIADSPDTQFAAERLLKNQEDIGAAIVPIYGQEAGDRLTALLKDHILIAVDIVDAAKVGDSAAQAEAEKRWAANAEEIATFLSEANPNWPKEQVQSMLNEHLSLTKSEAVARFTGDYAGDVAAFDAIVKHAESMADTFTDGIVAQFPEKFGVEQTGIAAEEGAQIQ